MIYSVCRIALQLTVGMVAIGFAGKVFDAAMSA